MVAAGSVGMVRRLRGGDRGGGNEGGHPGGVVVWVCGRTSLVAGDLLRAFEGLDPRRFGSCSRGSLVAGTERRRNRCRVWPAGKRYGQGEARPAAVGHWDFCRRLGPLRCSTNTTSSSSSSSNSNTSSSSSSTSTSSSSTAAAQQQHGSSSCRPCKVCESGAERNPSFAHYLLRALKGWTLADLDLCSGASLVAGTERRRNGCRVWPAGKRCGE